MASPALLNEKPTINYLHSPYLTDMYEITMCYAYWKNGMQNKRAAFEVFFRKCPFHGEYAVFAGLQTVIEFLNAFQFSKDDIEYLKEIIPNAEPEFYEYMSKVSGKCLTVYSLREGSMVFPMEPLVRVEGPLGVCQLIETPLLNVIGYPSLICTNAARMRMAAGRDKVLMEFGLRRAQGPDGGMSASEYAVMGGFDSTSNVLTGKLYGLPLAGTHAHSFIMSFESFDDVKGRMLARKDDPSKLVDFIEVVKEKKKLVDTIPIPQHGSDASPVLLGSYITNEGELAAFASYAISFPTQFCALCDTYNTLKSGVPNYLCIALALMELGYGPGSIRLDSGDLAYLSKEARRMFKIASEHLKIPELLKAKIVASNDINEETLLALNLQQHEIDIYGIGTNLVTCQGQPSMGVVYKLVELEGDPRIKLSDSMEKTTIPGRKECFRLISQEGIPILDLMQTARPTPKNEVVEKEVESQPVDKPVHPSPSIPKVGEKILCRHPHSESKRCYVIPYKVQQLHYLVWNGKPVPIPGEDGDNNNNNNNNNNKSSSSSSSSSSEHFANEKEMREGRKEYVMKVRKYVLDQLYSHRMDYLRFSNPTPYKVSLSEELYEFMHKKILDSAPIPVLDN